jgi:hypothetical protein
MGAWRQHQWRQAVLPWRQRGWRQALGPFSEIFPSGTYLRKSFKKRAKKQKKDDHEVYFDGFKARGHDIYILNNDEDKCWRAPIVNYFQDSDDSWMGTEQELLWKSYVNMSDI